MGQQVLSKEQLPRSLGIEGWPCRPGELQPTRLTPAALLAVVRRAAEARRYRHEEKHFGL